MSLNNKIVFQLLDGTECPIRLEDVEVEDPVDSSLGIRLGVGTCFRAQGSRYRVRKVYTRLNMEDILASLGVTEQTAIVHVHYIIEQMEESYTKV